MGNSSLKKVFMSVMVIILVLFSLACSPDDFFNTGGIATSEAPINDPYEEQTTLKVLVIEINPLLHTVSDNNKPLKASEMLFGKGEEEKALHEFIDDLQETSHGYLTVEIQREYLDEFPRYNTPITLNDGTSAYCLNEESYLKASGYDGKPKAKRELWWNLLHSELYASIPENSFDYQYIIDTFKLTERKNNGEFDQVWLLTIDPSATYETCMVGRTAYWINGEPIICDCPNFEIFTLAIARRDANLHAFAHGMEGILNNVFNVDYGSDYEADHFNVSSEEEYEQLNLWEKFILNSHNNQSSFITGVGNVHFPFNGTYDYDYTNKTDQYSSWQSWLTYPELTMTRDIFHDNAWMEHPINRQLLNDPDTEADPDRLYLRFWASLFPHSCGMTANGYLNNWWKYICSLDYVQNLYDIKDYELKVKTGETVKINLMQVYSSGETYLMTELPEGNNILISDDSVLGFVDGKLCGLQPGQATITIFYDGISVDYSITVSNSFLPFGW